MSCLACTGILPICREMIGESSVFMCPVWAESNEAAHLLKWLIRTTAHSDAKCGSFIFVIQPEATSFDHPGLLTQAPESQAAVACCK